ncbi:MAG: HD-GYP domain-containing protein [Leptothrix sp. (in: b-proteobacteria)]
MLKRIRTDQLRLGMHLHELCGSWMDHPFWRSRFTLRDPADLRRIVVSGIKEVWIDTDKGLDIAGGLSRAEVAEQVERELEVAATAPLPLSEIVVPEKPPASDASGELGRATQLRQQARQKVESLFNEARMGRAIHAEGCLPVVDEIMGSVERNPGALLSLIRLKTQDEYTYLHSVAVCTLMVALARTLQLPAAQVRAAGLAGMLHDMGKVRIPLAVLNKPGRLTDEEFALMRRHPQWGHELLVEGGGVPPLVLDVCLHHHEKIDGSGYPHGLPGASLSLFAKMGAVCDVYDAITSARPYKGPWDPGEAVRQMAQWKGHFDPLIFQAFVKTVGIYPIGGLVRLQSGRLGVVLEQGLLSLLTPKVKVFYSIQAKARIPPQVVDLAEAGCQDKVVGVESPEAWQFENLEQLWAGSAARR